MIKKIGHCSIGYPDVVQTEEFEFPDGTSDEEMEEALVEWANQFLETWFDDTEE